MCKAEDISNLTQQDRLPRRGRPKPFDGCLFDAQIIELPIDNTFGTRAGVSLGEIARDPEPSAERVHGVIGVEWIDGDTARPVPSRDSSRRTEVRRNRVIVRGQIRRLRLSACVHRGNVTPSRAVIRGTIHDVARGPILIHGPHHQMASMAGIDCQSAEALGSCDRRAIIKIGRQKDLPPGPRRPIGVRSEFPKLAGGHCFGPGLVAIQNIDGAVGPEPTLQWRQRSGSQGKGWLTAYRRPGAARGWVIPIPWVTPGATTYARSRRLRVG